MNFSQLSIQCVRLVADAFRQSSFTRSFLAPMVAIHSARLNFELSKSARKKVLFYYPMYTILACAEMYLALKGRGLNRDERKRLTLVAAMATLCDDLIDEDGWSRDAIFGLLSESIEEEQLSPKARLLLALNSELKSFWKLSPNYLEQLRKALEWQSESLRQLDPQITLDEIVDICRKKNGHTSLMFSTLLDENWTTAEQDFIYQSAIVGQLTNDSFDLYFDTHNGLNTYINRSESIAVAREFFIAECKQLHQLVRACKASARNKKACINRMSCMHAFTLVAFDHLQSTEDKYGQPVNWKLPARKEVVTDMAIHRNKIKLLGKIMWLSKV